MGTLRRCDLHVILTAIELTLSQNPVLKFTDQNLPFVIGEINNDAGYIRWVRLLISAQYGDQLLSCTVHTFPAPLNPAESRVFLETNLPGLVPNAKNKGIPLDKVDIEVTIELNFSRDFDEIPIHLPIEIDLYQPVGSSLILRGSLTNPEEKTIMQPTVFATVRTTMGELVSAGWIVVAYEIAPSETLSFVLPLTLPQNTDTVMSEFDVQAIGFEQ